MNLAPPEWFILLRNNAYTPPPDQTVLVTDTGAFLVTDVGQEIAVD